MLWNRLERKDQKEPTPLPYFTQKENSFDINLEVAIQPENATNGCFSFNFKYLYWSMSAISAPHF
jgi:hypothetical protein